VSYDDITLPPPPQPHSQPPAKKRKWSKKPKGRNAQSFNNFQKTNSNGLGYAQSSSSVSMDVEAENMEEDEEGRDLTHNEIWDDSALIDAWNAAAEEYEAYNGPEKGWKAEPVHKSPLWYNTPKAEAKPTAPSTNNGFVSVPATSNSTDHGDSRPLNFDTFVPSHDPSLSFPISEPSPISPTDGVSHFLYDPGPMVSQEEAFTRAMGAMYWSGYWTAMYHCQRRLSQGQPTPGAEQQGEEGSFEEADDAEDQEDDEEEIFVSTQR